MTSKLCKCGHGLKEHTLWNRKRRYCVKCDCKTFTPVEDDVCKCKCHLKNKGIVKYCSMCEHLHKTQSREDEIEEAALGCETSKFNIENLPDKDNHKPLSDKIIELEKQAENYSIDICFLEGYKECYKDLKTSLKRVIERINYEKENNRDDFGRIYDGYIIDFDKLMKILKQEMGDLI